MIYLLQHLLENSAQNYPDKQAVKYGEEHITYRELDLITNKLAHTLKDNGVQRGDRVGIYINKSIPSIISIYAILKADAVYVPLDPQAPTDRIAYIIENCEIKCCLSSTAKYQAISKIVASGTCCLQTLILTDSKLELELESLREVNTIVWEEVQKAKDHGINSSNIHNDLAYIIYTSGSTGSPKGVMISHLNSFTFVTWTRQPTAAEF